MNAPKFRTGPKTCPDCGLALPFAHERRGGKCPFQIIRAELRKSVDPWTEQDERLTHWLASWDEPTTAWVLSLVRRALASGASP